MNVQMKEKAKKTMAREERRVLDITEMKLEETGRSSLLLLLLLLSTRDRLFLHKKETEEERARGRDETPVDERFFGYYSENHQRV